MLLCPSAGRQGTAFLPRKSRAGGARREARTSKVQRRSARQGRHGTARAWHDTVRPGLVGLGTARLEWKSAPVARRACRMFTAQPLASKTAPQGEPGQPQHARHAPPQALQNNRDEHPARGQKSWTAMAGASPMTPGSRHGEPNEGARQSSGPKIPQMPHQHGETRHRARRGRL
jgi:hypothetical protein